MLKFSQDYARQSQETYEQAYQLPLKSMARRAAAMGYKLVPEIASPLIASSCVPAVRGIAVDRHSSLFDSRSTPGRGLQQAAIHRRVLPADARGARFTYHHKEATSSIPLRSKSCKN
jgi:hypothetical protein